MSRRLRLGIDLDGVVADFNLGWTDLHNAEFGGSIDPASVDRWDCLPDRAGFADMHEFWAWASPKDHRPSIFRHLPTYPGAIDALNGLAKRHHLVVVTTKPRWATHDTLAWLADVRFPTTEVHITNNKEHVDCDVYLDDSPSVLERLVRRRSDRLILRREQAWNTHLDGTHPVSGFDDVERLVDKFASRH